MRNLAPHRLPAGSDRVADSLPRLWLRVGCVHAAALLCAIAAAYGGAPGVACIVTYAAAAGLASCAACLPVWWLVFNIAFAPAAVLAHGFRIDGWWYLAAAVALLLVYGGTIATRVPLFFSGSAAVAALAELLPCGARCIDLGCGAGTVLVGLSSRRPDARITGVEAAPLPWCISRIRCLASGIGCRVRWGSFWCTHLGDYDVVYAFLSPAAMPRLWRKARREMRPGSILVSNSFPVPGVAATRVLSGSGNGGGPLWVWQL